MHVVLQWERLIISPDLQTVFLFLNHIEEEIISQLHIKRQLREMNEKFWTIMRDFVALMKLLEENKIEYTVKSNEKTLSILEDFKTNHNVRIIIIAMFSYLDTIFHLIISYKHQITDETKLMQQTRWQRENLAEKYLLSKQNKFYYEQNSRLKDLNGKKIKSIRNFLTHFFSLPEGIILLENWANENRDEIERLLGEQKMHSIWFTPEEWFNWIWGAVKIVLEEWTKDSLDNKILFKSKMSAVKAVINKHASVLMNTSQKR